MTIHALRILPPLSFARLGSAAEPLDAYTLEDDPAHPLGFRRIRGATTFLVDPVSGAITDTRVPDHITFKDADGRIRPVAPFLEVFAETADGQLEPLSIDLLAREGLAASSVAWRVEVANRKVLRRTGDPDDLVHADSGWFSDHAPHALEGHCAHFVPGGAIGFGHVRFIRPTPAHPEIRLRFVPAPGLIYGPNHPNMPETTRLIPRERLVYDTTKGRWCGFEVKNPEDPGQITPENFQNETMPPQLYAILPPAPPWLNDDIGISRGYLDDACDGFVEVALTRQDGSRLLARARVCVGPPASVPDSLFVRNLADELEQALHGPDIADDEPFEVTHARATDIMRRAFETVRFLNAAVMNGSTVEGRPPTSLDTMPSGEADTTQRAEHPIFSEDSVDTLAILALHQQVYTALRSGAAPWFASLIRQPDEVGDYTDRGRRKMPALMIGADNNYLALTRRQIDTIRKAVDPALFRRAFTGGVAPAAPPAPAALTPRNLSAQIHYAAAGNPASTEPRYSVANCDPGLEVDFRAVWRRVIEGIVLREYDNLVVNVEHERLKHLAGRRLQRIDGTPVMTQMKGDPPDGSDGDPVLLATDENPEALAPLEWSNLLARVLRDRKGQTVRCDFTVDAGWEGPIPWTGEPGSYETVELRVRPFFEESTAVISQALAQAGELTQGLCSPWQNDFRECACYYWASARPDYVNVEPGPDGRSRGDFWFQKERTGHYVLDDYVDSRLVNYDELFEAWERWLRFQVQGRDADRSKDPA